MKERIDWVTVAKLIYIVLGGVFSNEALVLLVRRPDELKNADHLIIFAKNVFRLVVGVQHIVAGR